MLPWQRDQKNFHTFMCQTAYLSRLPTSTKPPEIGMRCTVPENRLRGIGVVGGRKSPCSIDLAASGLYNSLCARPLTRWGTRRRFPPCFSRGCNGEKLSNQPDVRSIDQQQPCLPRWVKAWSECPSALSFLTTLSKRLSLLSRSAQRSWPNYRLWNWVVTVQ